MLIKLKAYSPFYAAYAPQSEAVNAAVEQAAADAAAKMGAQFSQVYAIAASPDGQKLAA